MASSRSCLRNPTTTEIIVIHEFLHALGLGENPPTSQAITHRQMWFTSAWSSGVGNEGRDLAVPALQGISRG